MPDDVLFDPSAAMDGTTGIFPVLVDPVVIYQEHKDQIVPISVKKGLLSKVPLLLDLETLHSMNSI